VAQVNDLSRSLTAFDPISTLVVVVEMSKASWLVSGVVPGVERQPLKKLEPDAENRTHGAEKIGLSRYSNFFNRIGPQRHFAAPNNNVAIGVTTDIDRHGY